MRKFILLLALAGALGAEDQAARDKATFEKVCSGCHPTSLVSGLKTQAEWKETVNYMVAHGAKGTRAELAAVRRHLARNFTRPNGNAGKAKARNSRAALQ